MKEYNELIKGICLDCRTQSDEIIPEQGICVDCYEEKIVITELTKNLLNNFNLKS